MSNAIAAYGTLLKIGDGGTSESFTTIAEVGDIDGPSVEVNAIDVTSHSSANAMKEFVAGLIDPGEISFPINFLPTETTHDDSDGLWADMIARTLRNFEMVFPDTSECAFAALVTAMSLKEPVDDKLSADVTLKISGPIVWTPAT